MGTLFRSKDMQLIQLYIQIDAARATIDELGNLGAVQFRDMNPNTNAFQRNFTNEIRKSLELERQLRFFQEEISKMHREEGEGSCLVSPPSETITQSLSVDDLELLFREIEKELIQINENQLILDRNFNELIEMKYLLEKSSLFLDDSPIDPLNPRMKGPGIGPELSSASFPDEINDPSSSNLGRIIGTIDRSRVSHFEKILWRTLRGNLFMKQVEIDEWIIDPQTRDDVQKNVFMIFFQGAKSKQKIEKIAEIYKANVYPCPEDPTQRRDLYNQIITRLEDLSHVTRRAKLHRRQTLAEVSSKFNSWKDFVVKEKSIYHVMNLFNYDVGRKCLVGEAWAPVDLLEPIHDALQRGIARSASPIPSVIRLLNSTGAPPTHHVTNSFTSTFQEIVDMYGVARYQEANPAVFTTITFPFLFAVMFGDIGHGLLLTLASLSLVYFAPTLYKNGITGMSKNFVDARYLLLLMSLFSIYTGFLYNECFSFSLDIFGSGWSWQNSNSTDPFAQRDPNYVYPIGVDPYWKVSKNELTYYNSLKMKMSVLFGVTQMSLGILISLTNGLYFRNVINIVFEFIPQLLFLWSIFGYMCFLVVLKWLVDWSHFNINPPHILNLLIAMLLRPTTFNDAKMFPGQHYVQIALILIAAVSVPWMLIPKPTILVFNLWKKQRAKAALLAASAPPDSEQMVELERMGEVPVSPKKAPAEEVLEIENLHVDEEEEESGEHEEISDIIVHQVIHTIEFVLGCISNTASYLRLWALSLAHSQLASVFWEHIMLLGWEKGNFIFIFICWALWAGLTVGVLLLMESLSASLHALRLHWVEFQNKFYVGDGYKFEPFSYNTIFDALREEEAPPS